MLGGLDHNILDLEGLEGVEEDEALTMEAGAEESLLNDPDLNAELQALDIGNGDLEWCYTQHLGVLAYYRKSTSI